jgi:hypothetical protein
MKPGDLVRLNSRWGKGIGKNDPWPCRGDILVFVGHRDELPPNVVYTLSPKGMVSFHVGYLELVDEGG